MQPDSFNSTKGTFTMWSKFFADKLDNKLDSIMANELAKTAEISLEKELEKAKSEALQKIVKDRVLKNLSKHFNTEVYEQTEKAIELFNSTLQEARLDRENLEETRKLIFNKVLSLYPKANTNYTHHYGYSFAMPEITTTLIANGITNKIIAEIAEMD